jgi:hypothetical protein
VLSVVAPAHARSLDLLESYSVAAYGGYEDRQSFSAGLQLMTLDGPGDSGYLMGHWGFGFDVGYAKIDGESHMRILPMAELLFFIGYLQAGVGPDFAVEGDPLPGVDFMLGIGGRMFLGDEYQSPSISIGARLDWLVGEETRFVPAVVVRLEWVYDP